MKKILFFSAMAVALVFASCGSKAKKADASAEATVDSFQVAQMTEGLKVKVDSLAKEIARLGTMPIFSQAAGGQLTLTDKEKKMPPTYLMSLDQAAKAETSAKKANLLIIYNIEMQIAKAYDMPVEEYKATLGKLMADLNCKEAIASFGDKIGKGREAETEAVNELYAKMSETTEGVKTFWRMMSVVLIENLYVLTQNIDKFMPLFTDETASEVSYRLILVTEAMKSLVEVYPDMADLQAPLKSLDVLNAIDRKQLREQALTLKGDIARQRQTLAE